MNAAYRRVDKGRVSGSTDTDLRRENKRLRCELATVTAQRNRFEANCSGEVAGEVRHLWGLRLRGKTPGDPDTGLLYDAWHELTEDRWPGEPNWPLLFRTRRQAVEWKRNAESKFVRLGWKFRVVRAELTVRER